MPDRDAPAVPLGDGWELLAAGPQRRRDGALAADVIFQNGRPVHVAPLALTDPAARAGYAATAHAAAPDGPDAGAIGAGLLALATLALGAVQGGGKATQAEALIALAGDAELWHTPDGKPFATLAIGDHREHWPLKSKACRHWLVWRYYQAHDGRAPGGQAVQDALDALAGRALFAGPEHPVSVRLAPHDGRLYLDLGGADWAAVAIGPDGWAIVTDPPVRFRRPRGLAPLPRPVPGGRLDQLRPFVNDGDDEDTWRLLVSWLLGTFHPRGPYPVLALHGEQGSAKTTTARALRRLVDPQMADLRAAPRDERDLAISAANTWIVGYDNLSQLKEWFSDTLCRLSTGGGLGTRELYSDDEEVLFEARRPVLLNGIEDLATRPDLLERTIVRHLPAIPDDRRRDEETFWREYEAAKPAILGALLDAVAGALARLPGTTLQRKPRLADFALWVTAAEPALGWPAGAFLRAYEGNRAALNDLALDASPLALAVRQLAERHAPAAPWQGTAAELLDQLGQGQTEAAKKGPDWPKTARALSGGLRRYAPNLRAAGVAVDLDRREPGGTRRRLIVLYQNQPAGDRPDRPDRPEPPRDGPRGGTDAGRSPAGETRDRPAPAGQEANAGAVSCGAGAGRDGRDGPAPLFPETTSPARRGGTPRCLRCLDPMPPGDTARYCPDCRAEG